MKRGAERQLTRDVVEDDEVEVRFTMHFVNECWTFEHASTQLLLVIAGSHG